MIKEGFLLKRKLQKTNKDQYILTIPKALVEVLNWKDKEVIEFIFDADKIVLHNNHSNNKFSSSKRGGKNQT
ncbi:AbrB/MazE/SpoVT family DNA-binding domain-containing protein [Candidatus Woesearchaeota archaeon]|nr:AbrB/MazE/SpoVT family DNA-binding domain-containing protein [Candidatus Woesearchaeota archaeon]